MRDLDINERPGFHFTDDGVVASEDLGLDAREAAVSGQSGELHAIYELTEDATTFLIDNKFLIELLNEAVPILRAHFGDDVRVRLELSIDPDRGSDRELFARILTNLGPKEALRILDRFDNDWWFDASPRVDCLLNFALRYTKNGL